MFKYIKIKKARNLSFAILSSLLFLLSCSNDDIPAYIHDHEAIHEVILQQTDLNGSNPTFYSFLEGAVSGDVINLTHGESYHFEIIGLNAHEDGEEHNIIDEMVEAVEEHFFLYSKSNSLDITLDRNDDDSTTRSDGTKIGVKIIITANSLGSGSLQFELKHQASEVDDQANNNFGSSVGGATDVLAVFPVIID